MPATLLPLEKVKQQNTPKQQQNEVVESAATDQTATEQSPQGSIKTLKEFHSVSWRNSIDFYSWMNILKDFYGIVNIMLRKFWIKLKNFKETFAG